MHDLMLFVVLALTLGSVMSRSLRHTSNFNARAFPQVFQAGLGLFSDIDRKAGTCVVRHRRTFDAPDVGDYLSFGRVPLVRIVSVRVLADDAYELKFVEDEGERAR